MHPENGLTFGSQKFAMLESERKRIGRIEFRMYCCDVIV